METEIRNHKIDIERLKQEMKERAKEIITLQSQTLKENLA
jgi:hypothetical protein